MPPSPPRVVESRNPPPQHRGACWTGSRRMTPQAWDRLVILYAPLVYRWCRRWDLRDQDIADILQDVFQAVAAHIATFRKERAGDTFRGWLRTIRTTRSRTIFAGSDGSREGSAGPTPRSGSRTCRRPDRLMTRIPRRDRGAAPARSRPRPDSRRVRGSHLEGVLGDHRRGP